MVAKRIRFATKVVARRFRANVRNLRRRSPTNSRKLVTRLRYGLMASRHNARGGGVAPVVYCRFWSTGSPRTQAVIRGTSTSVAPECTKPGRTLSQHHCLPAALGCNSEHWRPAELQQLDHVAQGLRALDYSANTKLQRPMHG